jgi:catechol 2,3-dioxygenase-like lactoylglutathione lyase family enzyme
MAQATLGCIAPSFIVSDVSRTIAYYREQLGFGVMYQQPEADPFFAIVRRDDVMIFVKASGTPPLPNSTRDRSMKWDAYVYLPDPDALAAEFAGRAVALHRPLGMTSEHLWGFEIRDPDGYTLFFGRPA